MNALTVQDLSFAYGPRQALCEVGFSLAPGRFAALLDAGAALLGHDILASWRAPCVGPIA